MDRLQSEKDDKLKYYIIRTLIVHPASIVKGLSETFETDFWKLWEIWKKQTDVYNFTLTVKEKPGVPERYPTSNMMDVSDSHPAFWDAHRESSENYHLSDDDLLYYWEPERDDIRISSNVKKWLFALKRQLHAIAGEQKYMFSNQEFRQKLTDLLYMCEDHYKRIYAFASMYDDFLDHSDDLMYQAALIVFEKVVEENWEAGREIEKFTGSWWDLCDRNITCNPGRMNVKRYLAVMANKDLRSKYLNF